MVRKANYYTSGYWNPLRLMIAHKVQEYPIISPGLRGSNAAGEEYNPAVLAKQLKCSYFMVSWISHALENGVIVPSDAEFQEATAKGIEIPLKPKVTEPTVVEQAREMLAKEPPKPDVTKSQMQKNVNNFVEQIESGRPIKLQPPADVTPPASTPMPTPQPMPASVQGNGDKPLTPEKKDWHDEKPKEPDEQPIVSKKEEKDNKKIVSTTGTFFESIHKVKLTLASMIWFTYCQMQYGYDGSIDDFINWCILDCIKARGLSIEVIEQPLNYIGAGIVNSMQYQEGGQDGGTTK